MSSTPAETPKIAFGTVKVDGLNVAYREAGDAANPKLALLHGFPSSSHQYRDLIRVLANRFHVIAPDYPGFGNSDSPDPKSYAYTFDNLSMVTEHFLDAKGFRRYGLFVQDYGGPVGFRIVGRHPEALEWLIIQNSNAYEEGFTSAWDGLSYPRYDKNYLFARRDQSGNAAARSFGRPPRLPFSREAFALLALRLNPPSLPICCIHRPDPKAPSMSPGT
jgi:pimeloyl-ACP methyl ester carboxylesterase